MIFWFLFVYNLYCYYFICYFFSINNKERLSDPEVFSHKLTNVKRLWFLDDFLQ